MQNTYQEKILDLETTNNSPRVKLEGGIKFKIKSDFQPAGDQPEAIKALTKNLKDKKNEQVLLGVTGSGKTFTMAKVIEQTNRPALILAPNKTLAKVLFGARIRAGRLVCSMTFAIVNVLPDPVTPSSTCSFFLSFRFLVKAFIASG